MAIPDPVNMSGLAGGLGCFAGTRTEAEVVVSALPASAIALPPWPSSTQPTSCSEPFG